MSLSAYDDWLKPSASPPDVNDVMGNVDVDSAPVSGSGGGADGSGLADVSGNVVDSVVDIGHVPDLPAGDFEWGLLGGVSAAEDIKWVDLEFLDLASGPPAMQQDKNRNKNPTLG